MSSENTEVTCVPLTCEQWAATNSSQTAEVVKVEAFAGAAAAGPSSSSG